MDDVLKKKWMHVVLSLAVVAIFAAGYFYLQVRSLKNNPQVAAEQETQALVVKVSKLIVLPRDEIPTVATVSDPEALKDQAFFARAEVGDKVLIYAEAKKAILYSVVLNKIIDVASLDIGAQKTFTPPPTPPDTTADTKPSTPDKPQ